VQDLQVHTHRSPLSLLIPTHTHICSIAQRRASLLGHSLWAAAHAEGCVQEAG
jgi:hypothetical protein